MTEKLNKEQVYTALFMNLVMSFQTAAMQQMGKMVNPITDKVERDMDQVRMTIDMLDMLKAKTKNNLGEYEENYLNNVISELKLNYVDESKKKATEEDKKSD
ncbi:DUF1844 domain-containing protein [candidate division KSB1 bacterium]|nr:DUF1844 domain-containing protein [candidate division KSB1 bacterium]